MVGSVSTFDDHKDLDGFRATNEAKLPMVYIGSKLDLTTTMKQPCRPRTLALDIVEAFAIRKLCSCCLFRAGFLVRAVRV